VDVEVRGTSFSRAANPAPRAARTNDQPTTAMLHSHVFTGLAACALLLFPLADIPRKAQKDETRTRTFATATAMTVTDMAMSMNGEEMDTERMRGGETTTAFALTVKDVFEDADGVRATKIRRTFDAVNQKSERAGGGGGGPGGGGRGGARELTSGLVGEDVLFTYDAEAGEYVASLPDDSALDPKLLEGLAGDLEFGAFLPEGDIEVGAEWNVPLEAIAAFIRPAGNLHLAPASSGEGEGERRGGPGGRRMGGAVPEDLGVEGAYDGSIKARLVEIAGDEGARTAHIELVLDLSAKYDMADAIEPVSRETEDGEITITTLDAVLTRKFEGKGKLEWSLDRGALVALTLEAELEHHEINATEMTMGGGDTNLTERDTTSEGTLTFEYRVE